MIGLKETRDHGGGSFLELRFESENKVENKGARWFSYTQTRQDVAEKEEDDEVGKCC